MISKSKDVFTDLIEFPCVIYRLGINALTDQTNFAMFKLHVLSNHICNSTGSAGIFAGYIDLQSYISTGIFKLSQWIWQKSNDDVYLGT